jgi:hypothetical protein
LSPRLESIDCASAGRVGDRGRKDDRGQASVIAGCRGDPIGEVAHVGEARVIAVHGMNVNRGRFAAQSIDGGFCGAPVTAAEQDVPACSSEFASRGIPDSARRTGHQHSPSHTISSWIMIIMQYDYFRRR